MDYTYNKRSSGLRGLFLILYVIFALYFLNYPLNLIEIPEIISIYNEWLIFFGGILILLGGINYFKVSGRPY